MQKCMLGLFHRFKNLQWQLENNNNKSYGELLINVMLWQYLATLRYAVGSFVQLQCTFFPQFYLQGSLVSQGNLPV